MDIADYLIDQEGQDWVTLLEPWYWKLPNSFQMWLVNKLGDLILVLEDEQIYFFDIAAGTIEWIAEDRDDFVEKINEDDNAELWLGISLVDGCIASGMTLTQNQCFGYITSPVLGGEFEVSNLEPTELRLYYSIHGQIHEQIKDVPEGSTVTLNILPPGMTEQFDEE